MEGTLMQEYRITVEISERGRADVTGANAQALLAGFLETHPETGPVGGADLERSTVSITFSLKGEDANDALDRGNVVFADGASASGLDRTEIVALHVEAVAADELEAEPIPA